MLIALILGVSGCISPPMDLPDWNLAARVAVPVTDPMDLPDLCEIPHNGRWSAECWRMLDMFDIVASTNKVIAQANANALRTSDAAYDSLIEAGKLQQQLSRIRQEMLERERRAHTMDNWFYRITIILGIGVGVAL